MTTQTSDYLAVTLLCLVQCIQSCRLLTYTSQGVGLKIISLLLRCGIFKDRKSKYIWGLGSLYLGCAQINTSAFCRWCRLSGFSGICIEAFCCSIRPRIPLYMGESMWTQHYTHACVIDYRSARRLATKHENRWLPTVLYKLETQDRPRTVGLDGRLHRKLDPAQVNRMDTWMTESSMVPC